MPKYHRSTNGTTKPIAPVRPLRRVEADGDAEYDSVWAALTTQALVVSETCGNPRSARLTVAVNTPASSANLEMFVVTFSSGSRGSARAGRMRK